MWNRGRVLIWSKNKHLEGLSLFCLMFSFQKLEQPLCRREICCLPLWWHANNAPLESWLADSGRSNIWIEVMDPKTTNRLGIILCCKQTLSSHEMSRGHQLTCWLIILLSIYVLGRPGYFTICGVQLQLGGSQFVWHSHILNFDVVSCDHTKGFWNDAIAPGLPGQHFAYHRFLKADQYFISWWIHDPTPLLFLLRNDLMTSTEVEQGGSHSFFLCQLLSAVFCTT